MTSFFNTTAKLLHRTPLPPGIPRELAISQCHNHDVVLRFDPEFAHYESLPDPESDPRGTKFYEVTDHMQALPKGLWDSTVTYEAQITNEEFGNEYVVKAPLGLVQVTKWTIELAGEGEMYSQTGEPLADGQTPVQAEWCLNEDVEIRASRFLIGTVKSKCESSWRGIHSKFIKTLLEAAANTQKSAAV